MTADMDLASLIRQGSTRFGERPVLVCDGSAQTYGQCYARASRLANALADLGLNPGDRVATLVDNSPEALELIFGVALGGFVRSSLYTHNTADTNVYLMDVIGATALVVQSKHHPAIAPYVHQVETLKHVIVCDGDVPDGVLGYEEILASASADDPQIDAADDAPQTIRFSAGTTGRPKGIMHDKGAWTALGVDTAATLPDFTPADRYLCAGPLSHASIMPMPAFVSSGGSILLMRAFEPGAFLANIERHRCTFTFGVPLMIHAAATHPDATTTDLSSLRCIMYGGSPISPETMRIAREVFGDVLLQMYGQSEGAPATALLPEEHVAENGRWLRSAGRAAGRARIRIVDEHGMDLPPGEVGEVAVHTPTAFSAIWGDEAATRARFLGDGALLTRDMGYLDPHGFLFLTDRKEDMIISGGHNIWPAELEVVLAEHPGVAEAAVVGIPHPKWGETPLGLVVRAEGAAVSAEDLIAWTRDKLGGVKKLGAVMFGDSLPRSAIGKLQRRQIREWYEADSDDARRRPTTGEN